MGLIKRNNSKFWYVQFVLDGRPYVKSTRTTDKRLAEQIEIKLRNEVLHRQTFGLKDRIKVGDLVSAFLQAKTGIASYSHYCQYGRTVCKTLGKDVYIDKLTRRDTDKYRQKLVASGQKPATVRHYVNFLRTMLSFAKDSSYLTPELDVPSVKQEAGRLRYLSVDEERTLLASLDPKREIRTLPSYDKRSPKRNQALHDQYDFVVTLLDTGARHSEITTLEWKAIDLENRTIRLWRPKVRNQSIIYISERLYGVLKRRFDARNHEIPYVFHTKMGGPKAYCSGTARRIFDRVGLHDCSFHTLRHTLASRLIQNGLNIYEVKEILGHTDIKTTMRYAHLERMDVSRKMKETLDKMRSLVI